MDLILWRHAEVLEPKEGEESYDQPLTRKGERQAQRMAKWLNQQLPESTRIFASPARCAVQTATALDRKFRTQPAFGPIGTVESLMIAARWPDAREPVLVVGHQPLLGLVAAYLLCGQGAQAWSVRKGAAWWLRGRERAGEFQVTLHAAVSPELV